MDFEQLHKKAFIVVLSIAGSLASVWAFFLPTYRERIKNEQPNIVYVPVPANTQNTSTPPQNQSPSQPMQAVPVQQAEQQPTPSDVNSGNVQQSTNDNGQTQVNTLSNQPANQNGNPQNDNSENDVQPASTATTDDVSKTETDISAVSPYGQGNGRIIFWTYCASSDFWVFFDGQRHNLASNYINGHTCYLVNIDLPPGTYPYAVYKDGQLDGWKQASVSLNKYTAVQIVEGASIVSNAVPSTNSPQYSLPPATTVPSPAYIAPNAHPVIRPMPQRYATPYKQSYPHSVPVRQGFIRPAHYSHR